MGEAADDTLAPGTTLGRYEIRRQLGRGGMGAVYEAMHRDLKKRVAIKVLSSSLASNVEAQQRFLREGEAASRIQHPHVVDVTDVGTDGARTYLVMELLEGEDLASRLARMHVLSVRETADVMLPVCAGLSVAHEEGVIHRDLKPENIFLARRRQGGGIEPKLLDFGVSKVTGQDAALTGTSATFGTPYYMPTEQVRGARQADQRSDVYALGVILYECVCGRRPFQADNIYSILHAIGSGQYPTPRSLRGDVPPAFEAVILRAMRLDPAERQPTARAFGAALLPFASENVRGLWADTFVGAGGGPDTAPRASGMDRTVLADSVPPPRAYTTLGAATGQHLEVTPDLTGRRGVTPAVAVVGGLALAAGIAVAIGVGRQGSDHAPVASAPTAVTATATSTPAAIAPAPAPAPASSFHVDVDTDPAGATLELDGVPIGAGPLRRDLARDGRAHRLVARAAGRETTTLEFTDRAPRSPLVLPPSSPQPSAPPPVTQRAHHDKPVRAEKPKGGGHHPKPAAPVAAPAAHAPAPPPPAQSGGGNRVPVLD